MKFHIQHQPYGLHTIHRAGEMIAVVSDDMVAVCGDTLSLVAAELYMVMDRWLGLRMIRPDSWTCRHSWRAKTGGEQ